MNMTVNMIFGFDPLLHAMKKIHAPCSHSTDGQVSESKRRTVSDEENASVANQMGCERHVSPCESVVCRSAGECRTSSVLCMGTGIR